MLKENKFKVILSSAMILLPILFGLIMWNELPDTMTTHWGADGNADGFSAKPFAVFGLPVMILALHLIGLLFTAKDEKQKGQNKKALNMIFWIAPLISLYSNGMVYAIAFGKPFDFIMLMPALFGIMFVFIGNYLPKVKQNRTLGIKVSWALNNEENWNKTHRLGGKVWVVSGLAMLFSIFLPQAAMVPIMVCAIIAAAVIPIVYSYCIYKKHQKEGIAYVATPSSKAEKIAIRITAVIVPIILVGVAILMFTGGIKVQCEDTSFRIEASYWADVEIDYSEIDSLVYRDNFDTGERTNGFGSPRLSMGTFQNDEFGSYTLYAYTGAEEYIVLEIGKKTLVIGMRDADETQELYQSILAKMDK